MGLSEADLPQMKANISGEATSITYIHLQDVYNQIITCVGDGNLRIMAKKLKNGLNKLYLSIVVCSNYQY